MNNSPDMIVDIESTDWMRTKIQSSRAYAQQLYAAVCNNKFQRNEILPILKNETWSTSWRSAAGAIAEIQNGGDYLELYCTGDEGKVTQEIKQDLFKLGWVVV